MTSDNPSKLQVSSICVLAIASIALSACTPTLGLVPQDKWTPPGENPWKGPAVQVLVNHITCQLIRDYRKHKDEDSWERLAKYHFVAAVSLNLTVSNNESISPSFGFITPLMATGHPINPVITNPNPSATPAQTLTATTFNRTLTVGFQVNGTQTNSPTLTYQIDMQRIAQAALADQDTMDRNRKVIIREPNTGDEKAARRKAAWQYLQGEAVASLYKSTNAWCDSGNGENGFGQTLKGDLLQGDLGIEYNIQNGLGTLNAVDIFNVYGSGGPTSIADVGANVGPDTLSDANITDLAKQLKPAAAPGPGAGNPRMTLALQAAVVGGGGKGQGGGQQATTGSASSSFAAVVTFNVLAGVNAGENWTLQLFKGPGGGAGGGGSGSGSGSGSGGGGGSGGGSGQPLSVSRTATDILTVTYAPTCKTNIRLQLADLPTTAINPAGSTVDWSFSVTAPKEVGNLLKSNGYDDNLEGEISIPVTGGHLTSTNSENSTIILKKKKSSDGSKSLFGIGSVSWNIYQINPHQWNFVGQVATIQSGTAIGTILIGPTPNSIAATIRPWSGTISDDAITKLAEDVPTTSYWNTIPGCDVTAGPYIQDVVAEAARKSDTLATQSRLSNY